MKIILLSILFLGFLSKGDSAIDEWIGVYNDAEVSIEMKNNTQPIEDYTFRFIFRWVWSKERALELSPGVFYKSRIETTEINFKDRRYKTINTKLFDSSGKEIYFDLVMPSMKWDLVKTGSIMEKVLEKARLFAEIRNN